MSNFNLKQIWFDFWGKADAVKSNVLNSIFARIDSILYKTIDRNEASPPTVPVEGEIIRIIPTATDQFVTKEDWLAYYYNGAWRLIEPKEGFYFYDKAVGSFIYYDGTKWTTNAPAGQCYQDHNLLHNYEAFEHIDWSEPGPVLIDVERLPENLRSSALCDIPQISHYDLLDISKTGDDEHIDWSEPGAEKVDRERIEKIVTVQVGNIHGGGHYLNIDENGHLTLHGDATVFEDLRFPFTRDKQGQNDKPDFDFTNFGLLFPQNDTTEIAYIIVQFEHAMEQGSVILPHVHFNQTSVTTPTFKMDYRWYDLGNDPTGSFTTVTFDSFVFTYVSGTISQVAYINGGIDGSSITGVSSFLECKFYRDDNDVVGDVLTKEFDIHIERDSLGSNTEFTK